MRKLALLLLVILLVACAPARQLPGLLPTAAETRQTYNTRYPWDIQGPPSARLASALASIDSTDQVTTFLKTHVRWQAGYDDQHLLSPDEFLTQGFGVCSAFARFWCLALAHQGFKPELVAFWWGNIGHAVALWPDVAGQYRFASNFDVDPRVLGTDHTHAVLGCAQAFCQDTWTLIWVYDAEGAGVRQTFPHPASL